MQAATESARLLEQGNALLEDGSRVEAAEAFLACLRLAPSFGAAYVNLAATLHQLALLEQAQEMAEFGVQLLPHSIAAKLCLAHVLHDRADHAGAATAYRQVLARAPDHAGALSSLANTLDDLGRHAEALALHDRAVAAAPDQAQFRYNRGLARLASGDFAGGWDDHEARLQRGRAPPRGFGAPWQGEDLAGRTILLHAEQGLGDTLQFVRYVPMVAARGGRVLLEVPKPLLRLLRNLPGVARLLACGEPLPAFDTHCPLLSLPRAFATRLETIPGGRAYLHAAPAAAAAWRPRLPAAGCGLRVGLVWAGAAHRDDIGAHLIDRRRSLALTALAPLAEVAGVQLVSLQQHGGAARDAPPPAMTLFDPMPLVDDFADTAAIVAHLDLVVSVDTAVAHLAGGMGRPVWLLSRHDGCWRWLRGRDDSPWYPQMRLYRQERPNDWSGAVARMGADLAALAAGAMDAPGAVARAG